MATLYSVSLAKLILVFVAGFALGWTWSRLRIGGSANFSVSQSPFGASKPEIKKSVRLVQLKCQCGERLKFGDLPDSSQPISTSDLQAYSITCPKCGRVTNLGDIQALLKDVSPQ